MTGADIEAAAAEWLIRKRDAQGWRAEDDAALDVWLAQSPAHEMAYWRLEAAWARADRLTALSPQSRRRMLLSAGRKAAPIASRAAAAIVVMAGIALAANALWPHPPQAQIYKTAVGGRETLSLADGSQIELNTDTEVRIAGTANERKVWLEKGEVYLQIKHNPNREFVVLAGNRRIVDLGTKFVVRRDADKLEVSLLEGRARLEAAGDGDGAKSIELEPGDIAIAKANQTTLWKKPVAALADTLAWRKGLLVFDDTPLAEVASEFNRYNRKKLVVVGDAARKLAIGGHFQADNVETFARVAQGTLGLHVENKPDEIVITR
jgi:transmembrane sensor